MWCFTGTWILTLSKKVKIQLKFEILDIFSHYFYLWNVWPGLALAIIPKSVITMKSEEICKMYQFLVKFQFIIHKIFHIFTHNLQIRQHFFDVQKLFTSVRQSELTLHLFPHRNMNKKCIADFARRCFL